MVYHFNITTLQIVSTLKSDNSNIWAPKSKCETLDPA
jgi:hypothetical protein